MSDINYSDLHILVIDDEPFMRKLLERLLNDIGTGAISLAANGVEGLSIVGQSRAPIDLVICDLEMLEMPEMNGLEFVKTLRSQKNIQSSDLPVLILTGHSGEDSVRNAASLGINGYLVKPISRNLLEARIAKAISTPATNLD